MKHSEIAYDVLPTERLKDIKLLTCFTCRRILGPIGSLQLCCVAYRCASPTGYDFDFCNCPDGIDTSPIVIDLDGTGFFMTDAIGGVPFDILNDNVPVQLS